MAEIAMQDASILESTARTAAAGDQLACARLVQEHYAPMVRAAYVVVGDAELAREATQIASWVSVDAPAPVTYAVIEGSLVGLVPATAAEGWPGG